MAITVTKQKVKQVLAEPELVEEPVDLKGMTDEELADQYGELLQDAEVIIQEYKNNPTLLAFDKINKELQTRLKEELEPTDTAMLEGTKYILDISACSKSARRLDQTRMADLEKALGRELFLKIIKITMKDLEQYLGKAMIDKYIDGEVTYTDTRKITVRPV